MKIKIPYSIIILITLIITLIVVISSLQFNEELIDLVYALVFSIIGIGFLSLFTFERGDQEKGKRDPNLIKFNNINIHRLRKKRFSPLNINQIRTEVVLFIIGISLIALSIILNFLEIVLFKSILGTIMFVAIIWVLTAGVYVIFQRADAERRLYILIVVIGGIGTIFVILSYIFNGGV